MVIFSQREHLWGDKQLGNSGLEMKHFGCLITDIAQALSDSGYPVDPGIVVDKLSSINGFTDNHYGESSPGSGDGTSGLLWWNKLTEAYPQIHLDSGHFSLVQGTWGKYLHWVLKTPDGSVTDPFFGAAQEPNGFKENGKSRSISIDPASSPSPTPTLDPAQHSSTTSLPTVDVNLKPDAEWDKLKGGSNQYQDRGEVKRLQDRLVAMESLPEYDKSAMEGDGHGFFGPITILAVVQFQIAKGVIAPGSTYPATYAAGWVGPKTRSLINV